jgi:hypothetical protein
MANQRCQEKSELISLLNLQESAIATPAPQSGGLNVCTIRLGQMSGGSHSIGENMRATL